MAEKKIHKTYIRGFDEQMEGGIPHGHVVLVTGTPGTMKSTLAYSILHNNGVENGTKGMYVTLEQSRESLSYHLNRIGLDTAPLSTSVEINDLGMIRKTMEQFQDNVWMNMFKSTTQHLITSSGTELMVVDSLPVLELIAGYEKPREELFKLFEWFRGMNVTSFLVTEMAQDSREYSKYDEDFLCDGIIHLTMDKVNEIDVQRRIRCVKMRGVNHSTSYFTLLFKGGRFQVTRSLTE